MRFCYFNKGIFNISIEGDSSSNNLWYQYIRFNQCNYDTSNATLNLSSEDFTINRGNTHIVEIQNVSDSDLKYVWCPADIITFINELNSKVVSLESSLSTLNTEIQTLNTRIQELEQSQGN